MVRLEEDGRKESRRDRPKEAADRRRAGKREERRESEGLDDVGLGLGLRDQGEEWEGGPGEAIARRFWVSRSRSLRSLSNSISFRYFTSHLWLS